MKKHLSIAEMRERQLLDRPIRTAFVQATVALGERPLSCRTFFNNIARSVCPSAPWAPIVSALRLLARAAALTENPIVVEETRVRIESVFAAMCAASLAPLPERSDLSIVQAVLEETEAQGPADCAEAELLTQPTARSANQRFVDAARRQVQKLLAAISASERVVMSPSESNHGWGIAK